MPDYAGKGTSNDVAIILKTLELVDNKVDNIAQDVRKVDIKVENLQTEQIGQTITLNLVNEKVKTLDNAHAKQEEKVSKVDKETGDNTSKYTAIKLEVDNIKTEVKPALSFIEKLRAMMFVFIAIGGVIGSVITAAIINALHLK